MATLDRDNSNKWLAIFQAAGIFLLLVVCGRLFWLQVIRGGSYEARAETQHIFKRIVPAPRGGIYDRNMRPLAQSMPSESVWVYIPALGKDGIPNAATMFSNVLGGNAHDYFRKLSSGRKYIRIARHLSKECADQLRESAVGGLDFFNDPLRYYPNGRAAAQLIGFCDPDSNGLEGLEKQFDRYLKGQDGYMVLCRDARGKPISTNEDSDVTARPGYDVTLTLDLWIQSILEEEMLKQCKKYPPKGAVGVVMDVKTGEVLAMASWPFYDPNKFSMYEKDSYRNKAITDIYEPGSMAKGYTAAAALENNIMTPETIIDCEGGRYYLHGRTVKDAGHHGFHEISLTQVIAKSSNVGAAKIGEAVGKQLLYDTLVGFGMNEKSGIGLWGEQCSWLYPPRKWSKKSVASISFGYELCITPIALARSYCAIANDGILPPAKIIQSITDNDRRKIKFKMGRTVESRKVISKITSRKLRKILRQVVVDGTCKRANIPEYKIAGKTGTAIKVVNGRYDWSKTLGSFIGFAPVDNPRIVVLVSLDEPTKAQYGGVVAGPAVREVILRTLKYLGVPEESTEY